MKPVYVNSSPCIDFNKENNKEDSKCEVGDRVRILKYNKKYKRFYPKLF